MTGRRRAKWVSEVLAANPGAGTGGKSGPVFRGARTEGASGVAARLARTVGVVSGLFARRAGTVGGRSDLSYCRLYLAPMIASRPVLLPSRRPPSLSFSSDERRRGPRPEKEGEGGRSQ